LIWVIIVTLLELLSKQVNMQETISGNHSLGQFTLWPDTVNKWSWSLICPRWYANGCCSNIIREYPLSLIDHLWWSLYPANAMEEFFMRKVPLSFMTVHLHVVDIGGLLDKWECGAWSSMVSKLPPLNTREWGQHCGMGKLVSAVLLYDSFLLTIL